MLEWFISLWNLKSNFKKGDKMKKYIIGSLFVVSSLVGADLKVDFIDKKWDGVTVPKDEVCSNYNTKAGSTPPLLISNIPSNGAKIIFTYNDKTFTKMDNGGHGILALPIAHNTKSISVPAVAGETFAISKMFEVVEAHTGTRFNKTAGAYLAPCSGGKNNTYTVNISVVDDGNKTLSSYELTLGKF